jgi:plasmid stabilization system protein ParE
MGKITWSELALNDLDIIHDFISLDSAIYARKFVEKLISSVSVLQQFPNLG